MLEMMRLPPLLLLVLLLPPPPPLLLLLLLHVRPPRAAHRPAAARRSQACRRACPARARTTPAGRGGAALGRPGRGAPAATPRPANSLSAVRVRGRRVVVKDVGVRPPNDGQAAADE
jgi:hypothetical protein